MNYDFWFMEKFTWFDNKSFLSAANLNTKKML